MEFMKKMERRFGRYSISHLTKYIIIAYVIGYIMLLFRPQWLYYLTLEPYFVMRGQIWRLFTWILIPPSSFDLFTIIMLSFYYWVGTTLERTWGYFRYNLYIFGGMLFNVLAAFGCYFVQSFVSGMAFSSIGWSISTYYICMSLFFAFAMTYPDTIVYYMMIIPLKVKWISAIYVATLLLSFINSNWVGRVIIIASVLNFLIFFLTTRNLNRFSPHEIKRKQEFKKKVEQAQPKMQYRFKCAVCGRTDVDHPELEFRYCSKCNGSFVYCNDHLFTHEHVK